jgi:dihydrofolate reductase
MSAVAGDKNIWIVGGGGLVAQFMEHGLVDEMHVTYMPVVLGSGKPLLPVGAATDPLRLLDVKRFQSGAIELRYTLH